MQDRFKFRAYDKEFERMLYPEGEEEGIDFDGNGELVGIDKTGLWNGGLNCIPMQCTGLKDKNGKLIYEGDIVKFNPELFGKPKQIIWDECHYALKNTFIILCNMEIEQFGLEVIGNVYQNPELLED